VSHVRDGRGGSEVRTVTHCEASPVTSKVVNAFTVDVEDYFQVSAFEPYIDRSTWPDYEQRVVHNTQAVLELLGRFAVRATFYILGWVAERHPRLVREIAEAGHEVGCHSYWHRLVYELQPEDFRADLRRARQAIQDAAGVPVMTYRAPSFSVTAASLWALDILAEEGFRSDSSVFPIYHDRYGIPGARRTVHELTTPRGSLWEFPPSVVRLAGINLPVSGGGYFRLYPVALSRHLLRRINKEAEPFVFYIHPWELDPGQPRLKFGSPTTRLRHYLNLERTQARLERLLAEFRFEPISSVIERVAARRQAAPTGQGKPSGPADTGRMDGLG
jgi:polysaccharide deacetylase family protein (PEP-CTERM system associated)